jgi:hypothetical protein
MSEPIGPPGNQLVKRPRDYSHLNRSGRRKGQLNRTTVLINEAMMAVYQDLQDSAGGGHAHFKNWAREHPTEFYKMCLKLLPIQVMAEAQGVVIGEVVFRGINDEPD